MSRVLVVLTCYLLAFNFAAKTEKEGEGESESEEGNDENRHVIGDNNPDPLKPLVLIVKSTILNEIFDVEPRKNGGVRLDRIKMQDTEVDIDQLPLNERKMYLCPHPTVKDILGKSHDNFNSVLNCLYVTKFPPNEPKKCAQQPKSITFIYYRKPNQPIRDGKFAVKFCYPITTKNETQKCHIKGIRKFFNKPIPLSEAAIEHNYLNLYHFGYDEEEERTAWTTQMVIPMSTPGYFTLQPSDVNTLSQNGRNILEHKFDLLINAYNTQDKTKQYWLAHRLAQPTQYPFNIMTMATSEIVNTAPLQNKLQPLIYLIEERIQKLSDHISKPLKVMTKPLHYEFHENVGKFYLDENRRFLIPNVWIKQIYDEASNTGIVIVVHNYPEDVPSAPLLCKEKTYCNFQKWKTESSQFKDAFDETSFKFAYCCKEATVSMLPDVDIWKVIDINF